MTFITYMLNLRTLDRISMNRNNECNTEVRKQNEI